MFKWRQRGKNIVFRQGHKEDLPSLYVGEIGFCSDSKEFFIGTDSGNVGFTEFHLLATHMYTEQMEGRYFIGLNVEGYRKFKEISNNKNNKMNEKCLYKLKIYEGSEQLGDTLILKNEYEEWMNSKLVDKYKVNVFKPLFNWSGNVYYTVKVYIKIGDNWKYLFTYE